MSGSVASLTLYVDLMNGEAFGIRGGGKFNVVGIHKPLENFLSKDSEVVKLLEEM